MMEKRLKQVPYGEAEFKTIRFGNYVYVDKTRYIEALENCGTRFPFFVRPRRFGKSLFTDTLSVYYDKAEAGNFDKNFAGTYIGGHKTALANQFYILQFIFAGMSGATAEEAFYSCVMSSLDTFFNSYPHPRQNEILQGKFPTAAVLIERFFSVLGAEYCKKVFIIIDEYDQFANSILSNDLGQFRRMTSADGFLKDFYTKLKSATTNKGPVGRIFITGVTSISLDSMISGFSIATNLTTDPEFAGLYGFSEAEVREIIPQVVDLEKYGLTTNEVVARMKEWYNGYRFSPDNDVTVFNASMCFYYLRALQRLNREPSTLLDPSFAPDLNKISGILRLGNPDFVKTVVTKALRQEPIEFGAGDLQVLNLNQQDALDEAGILSAMVYLGYLTFADRTGGSLTVPNKAVAIQFFEYYLRNFLSAQEYSFNAKKFAAAFKALAAGNPKPLFEVTDEAFAQSSGIHTALHLTESDFQTLLAAALFFTDDFVVTREIEAFGGEHPGYVDILISPAVGCSGPSYIVELKYLTKKAGTEVAVSKALRAAGRQAQRYAASVRFQKIPNLHCVAAVYVGTQLKAFTCEAAL